MSEKTPRVEAAETLGLISPSVAEQLGSFDADEYVVTAAYHRAVKDGHPDHGGTDDVSKLQEAKDVLLGDSDAE